MTDGLMVALVCGGRDFDQEALAMSALAKAKSHFGFNTVIHGGARGADRIAGKWATVNGLPSWVFLAEWHVYGQSAGPIRNQQMLDEGHPSMILAFPGGRGTRDMIERGLKAGVPVYGFAGDRWVRVTKLRDQE